MIGLAAAGLLTQRRVPDVVGPAQVIDGDSIRVAGIEITPKGGMVLAVSSGTDIPAQMRAAGAATIHFHTMPSDPPVIRG